MADQSTPARQVILVSSAKGRPDNFFSLAFEPTFRTPFKERRSSKDLQSSTGEGQHDQEHDLGKHADGIAARSKRARHAARGKTARPETARSEQGPEPARGAPFQSRRVAAAGGRRARRLPGGRVSGLGRDWTSS